MSRAQDLFTGMIEGVAMARENANVSRQMAREFPRYANQYEAEARAAFSRARRYLVLARSFRSSPNASN